MQLYDCKVRLSGSLYNEVPKTGVTAAEITVLRVIHGSDSVADIKPDVFDRKRSDGSERARLDSIYGSAISKIEDIKSLNGIFGVAAPLPQHLPGFEPDAKQKKKAGRPPKQPPKQPVDAEPPTAPPAGPSKVAPAEAQLELDDLVTA